MTPEQRDVIDRIRSGRPQKRLTPTEVAAVVERVRANMAAANARFGGDGRPPLEESQAAARYMHDEGVSARVAAELYGVDQSTVRAWYRRLYPDEPRRPGPRSKR